MEVAVVAVFVVPVSWVSQGGLEHTSWPVPTMGFTVMVVLVALVWNVWHGGSAGAFSALEVVAVLVVPVS